METPGDRFAKLLKQRLSEFSKTKFAIPAAIAIACLVYYLVLIFLTTACLVNLIAPLILLALLWKIGIKRVRRLLMIGAVATFFFAAILTAVVVGQLQHIDPAPAESTDGSVTGSVDPWYVDKGVPFTFRVTVNVTDPAKIVNSVHVRFVSSAAFSTSDQNLTLDSAGQTTYTDANNVTHYISNYTLTTTTSKPINQFIFKVDLNGTWVTAGEIASNDQMYSLQGPTYKDSWAIASVVSLWAVQIDFYTVFGPYAIVLGMIWWTRRARRMREKQIEKWQAEQKKEEAEKPKSGSKVPSLDAAMGKVEEGFVCSECGADVPADATVCPKCGEKFE